MRSILQKRLPKFYYLQKFFGNKPFTLLDVGSGNHSASKTKKLFPGCEYHGIDLTMNFNNDESDFLAFHQFYEMNLDDLTFDTIPEHYFDFVRMAHVIEHLHKGDKVIEGLASKLKSGGYIYIEYPGAKSLTLPSMHGTLNFYDDPTHVRVYSIPELELLLRNNGFEILSSGTRRSKVFLAAMPFRILGHWLRGKKLQGNIFWDVLGFAEYIVARKK